MQVEHVLTKATQKADCGRSALHCMFKVVRLTSAASPSFWVFQGQTLRQSLGYPMFTNIHQYLGKERRRKWDRAEEEVRVQGRPNKGSVNPVGAPE